MHTHNFCSSIFTNTLIFTAFPQTLIWHVLVESKLALLLIVHKDKINLQLHPKATDYFNPEFKVNCYHKYGNKVDKPSKQCFYLKYFR